MTPFWTTVVNSVTEFFSALPFTGATWFVLATLAFFIWIFVKADGKPGSPVQWEHLIIDSNNDRTSPYKVGYLIGLIVATWIILTLTDDGKLDFDMFGVYLTYLLGGAGVNSFVKRGEDNRHDEYDRYNNYGEDERDGAESRQYGVGKRRKQMMKDAPTTDEPPEYGPSARDINTD